jgi:transcriptional regulator with XRE-family HTH domain
MNTKALVEALKARQEQAAWSQREMARELEISQSVWCRVISGKRRPGGIFLRAALARFPEYRETLFCPWVLRASLL